MNAIHLLYVENTISRKRGVAQQALTFCFYLQNRTYDKQVEVHWAGEDGAWQILPAAYLAPSGDGGELWLARTWRQSSPTASLPGNVEFTAVYRAGGAESWCKPRRAARTPTPAATSPARPTPACAWAKASTCSTSAVSRASRSTRRR